MTHKKHLTIMLTTSEVADLLHLHINTVRRWSNQGILKAYRVGPRGDRRFRKEDVNRFLEERKITPGDVHKGPSISKKVRKKRGQRPHTPTSLKGKKPSALVRVSLASTQEG